MSPGVEPGFCNLECWCHVPTRGVNKPPCYLCVINSCSLSSKKDVTPSAPDLTPTRETAPTSFPSHGVNAEALSTADSSSSAREYGWRGTFVRNASLETERGTEYSANGFREIFVQLPPEQNDQPPGESSESFQETEPRENYPIPEPDYPGAFEAYHLPREDHQGQDDGTAPDEESSGDHDLEESSRHYVTNIDVNWCEQVASQSDADNGSERSTDLADLIKSLVCDAEEVTYNDDEEGEIPERRNRTSVRLPNERNKTRRRRDKYQGLDKYQGFYSQGVRPLCIPRATRISHTGEYAHPVQNETEFQQLHKIHRRDTSSDAATRYLQSDENLHRTWMKEVALRRRNYPKRNRSTKKHEEGSHRPAITYEGVWRHHQKLLSKEAGVDT